MSETDVWDPGNPRNRDRTRESQRQVRRLLLGWDPIGAAGNEFAEDEYDFMISPVMHLLHEGANVPQLAQWIASQRHYMGLSRDDLGADQLLARDLASWWRRRTSGGGDAPADCL